MCIICNLKDPAKDLDLAFAFLSAFAEINLKMRAAEHLILKASEVVGPDDSKRYRRVHKSMVRIRRDWNRLEHEREYKE